MKLGLACALTALILSSSPCVLGQNAIALQDHLPAWVTPSRDLGRVSPSLRLDSLRLTLRRTADREAAFQQLLREQQDPASPLYHAWLTPRQIGEQFGAMPAQLAAVTHWLASEGLTVDAVANSRSFLIFHGTSAQVERAFQTELHSYQTPRGSRVSAHSAPRVPASLADTIASVQGLSQHHLASAAHAQPAYTACYQSECFYYVTPSDFATIYDANSVYSASINGSGQTIAIVGRAQVYSPDITEYEAQTGLPNAVPALLVPPEGVTPGAPNDSTTQMPSEDQTEATLDVQRSYGTAPHATVDLVASLSTQTMDGIDIAKDFVIDNASTLHTSILNISFGECEADVAPSFIQADDALFQQAAAEGVSVLVASGDAGAAGCDSYNATPPATQIKSPNYLCSSSYVTCLGGTEFNDTANPAEYWSSINSGTLGSALSYIPEGAWNEPQDDVSGTYYYYASSTGGGVSSVIPTPYWQAGTGVPGTAGRYTPDIAFSSSAHDGYYGCYAAGGGDCSANYFEYFYGTSAAAPSMAGVVALLNQKLGAAQGNLNPVLYALAANPSNSVFHDATITSSGVSNCSTATPSMCNNSTPSAGALSGGLAGYELTAGFDLATGWGSVDIANLLASWATGGPSASAATLTVAPSNSFSAGTTATLTAKVTGSGGVPTGTVQFLVGSSLLATQPLISGTATLQASTTGLAPGTYPVTAVYSGSNTLAPSHSSVVNVTIQSPGSTTVLTVSPSDSFGAGTTATLTAKVTSAGATPTGSVQFFTGTTLIGTAALVPGTGTATGTATLSALTTGLPTGSYPVVAKYSGSSTVQASTSATVTVTLLAASATALAVSPTTVTPPASITLTATVSGSAGTPAGTVTFYYGTLTLGSANLSSGTAALTEPTSGVPAGSYPVHAVYAGSAMYGGSTSGTVTVTVK